MSDTPRTEAEVNRQKCWSDDLITIDANFACQLERELNAANQRIKKLEEELERTKQDRNTIAKNTREPLLLKLDHANERINRLEDRINRASIAFFEDGSDARVARWMMDILEEERRKP